MDFDLRLVYRNTSGVTGTRFLRVFGIYRGCRNGRLFFFIVAVHFVTMINSGFISMYFENVYKTGKQAKHIG